MVVSLTKIISKAKSIGCIQVGAMMIFSLMAPLFQPIKVLASGAAIFSGGYSATGSVDTPISVNTLSVVADDNPAISVRLEVSQGNMDVESTPGAIVEDNNTSIGINGTASAVNAALATLTYESVNLGEFNIKAYLLGPNEYYNSANGHAYRFVNSLVDFLKAKEDASKASQLGGVDGYLVTSTSEQENDFIKFALNHYDFDSWLAASDSVTEGDWYWVAGPENGQKFWEGGPIVNGGHAVNNAFNFWNGGEPNNAGEDGEDCGVVYGNSNGVWNDATCGGEAGYIIEYGSTGNLPKLATKNISVSITNNQSFTITNCDDLVTIEDDPTTYQYYNIYLANNINCAGVTFHGMFNETHPFRGVFDGKNNVNGTNFQIQNVIVDRSGETYAGLFNYTEGAIIKNVDITGASFIKGAYQVGSIVGRAVDSSIQNINSSADVGEIGSNTVGGIVGFLEVYHKNAAISNAYFNGKVTGSEYELGGIVGRVYIDSLPNWAVITVYLSNNSFDGTVSTLTPYATGFVGGVVGFLEMYGSADNTVITDGNVSNGTFQQADDLNTPLIDESAANPPTSSFGGLIGYAYIEPLGSNAAGNFIFTNNINNSNLYTTRGELGGLIGVLDHWATGKTIVSGNTNGGTISGVNGTCGQCGGLIGHVYNYFGKSEVSISNNTNLGNIYASSDGVGGAIGRLDADNSTTTIAKNILNGDISVHGGNQTGGLVGYISANNYANFNAIGNEVVGSVAQIGEPGDNFKVGGLIGEQNMNDSAETLLQNKITGSVSGLDEVGGLIGYVGDGYTQRHIASNVIAGTVSNTGIETGGLIGYVSDGGVEAGRDTTLENNYVSADVISGSDNYTGGLIGSLDVSAATFIRYNYVGGAVTSTGDYVGGLFGNIDSDTDKLYIDKSFASGFVSGGDYVGALVGDNSAASPGTSAKSSDLYFDIYRTGQSDCVGNGYVLDCFGVNEANSESNYFGDRLNKPLIFWDFISTWGTSDAINNGLPCLQWEAAACNPAGDSDKDGISNEIESAGPNDGDANGDGVADYLQANISTLIDSLLGRYQVIETNCSQNSNISNGREAINNADPGFDYIVGLTSFTSICPVFGYNATVTVYIYGNYDPTTFILRKYNDSNKSYTTLYQATLTKVVVGDQPALKAVYSVVDGGELDQDGIVNGVIIDPVGLASVSVGSPNTGIAQTQ